MDFTKINNYIKEFLDFNGYNSTLDCFEAEEKTKKIKQGQANINKVPGVSLLTIVMRHGLIPLTIQIL